MEEALRRTVEADRRFLEEDLMHGSRSAAVFQELNRPLAPCVAQSTLIWAGLELLPPELFLGLCRLLDVQSAIAVSQVSRRTRQLLAAIPEFQLVGQHASETLSLVLRVGLRGRIRPIDMWSAMRTRDCVFCGQFGGFLLVLTVQRCCYGCIRHRGGYRLMCEILFAPETGACLGRCMPPPHEDSEMRIGWSHAIKGFGCQIYATSPQTIADIAETPAMSPFDFREYPSAYLCQPDTSTALPFYDPVAKTLERGAACPGCSYDLVALAHDSFMLQDLIDPDDSYQLYIWNDLQQHVSSCAAALSRLRRLLD
ncbi:hypothetical protein CMQ_2731 [Grosmannia clavigera kw1407]|uniref:F-box domain-containing protein n=1 Tax=Grosmannia clavigera (strain kw1407 / UAMH 11150) TaxID=655863 RepID=F0XH35_GROCL|nr:uncharacterized protein CMQ_2731 [Grosmannia clavigera kw1407]EFX02802.1 hypothetical protein CMQ_2731 [Grosmannia clavigera kw1407]